MKPTVVCPSCNNDWMSGLERAVQPVLGPMILGQPMVLDSDAIEALAIWATKTALVFELLQQVTDMTASSADRKWFKDHRQPLPSVRIWVARYVGTRGASVQTLSTLMTYDIDDPNSVPEPTGFVATLTYGQVALRVAMMSAVPSYRAGFAVAEYAHTPLVWPPPNKLDWPPDVALNDDALWEYGGIHLPADGPDALHRYGPPAQG